MAVGMTYGYATEYHQHGIGAKLQLGIDSHWRIEPEMIYFAQNREVTTRATTALTTVAGVPTWVRGWR